MKAEGKRSLAREPLSPESLAWTSWGLALKQILSKYASVYRKCVSVATLDSAPGGRGGVYSLTLGPLERKGCVCHCLDWVYVPRLSEQGLPRVSEWKS